MEGVCWLNTLGIPSTSPPNLSAGIFLLACMEISRADSSSDVRCSGTSGEQACCLLVTPRQPPQHLPASVFLLIPPAIPCHIIQRSRPRRPPSCSFISVITSQQAYGSPSQHPLTLTMVGEPESSPRGIDED